MKIVIDIQDDVYRVLKEDIYPIPDIERLAIVFKVLVKKGIPLPKGHGRLIDADEILKEKRYFEDFDGDTFNIIHEETVINANTIIEADKDGDTDGKDTNRLKRTYY